MDRCPKEYHCGDCGAGLDADQDSCHECYSSRIYRSIGYVDYQLDAANERADRAEAMILRPALGSIEIKTSPYVPEGILLCHPATLDAAHANREGK